ncbi:amino acid ABC transporter permease [Clostridium sp. MB40-C1]|uniref:amino acid ABC transporter permease n=1 Tax=Clostridium sp. MB40-C1 TaxID=3070996 RepID=UPI0027DED063|nr:amino acid ABC transporter permease [Clostridium sp. MB40-C1]WMJ80137.1 amino acid ABC transporter permease [Clostridium sp. MB40-C1]
MDFSYLLEYNSFFFKGAAITIFLSFFTVIFGALFGTGFALMKLSKNKILKGISSVFIEIVRGTPLLVQLYILFYGLPLMGINLPEINAFGTNFTDFIAGILALTINSTAYVAEIIRGGIQSIDKGQMEAARSLGMGHKMAMSHIVIPQAVKNILPALGNEFITVIKESAIVSVIGIHEIMFNAQLVTGVTFKPISPYIFAALIYFVLTFGLSKLIGKFERKMKISD